MRPFSLQKKLIIFISIITVVSIAIVFGVVMPAIKKITGLKQNISATEKFLEKRYAKAQNLQQSVRRLEEIRIQSAKFTGATVQKGQELSVITELEKLAGDNQIIQNLDVKFLDPDDASQKNNPNKKELPKSPYYLFSFTNSGTFKNHFNYLKALESLPFYAITNSIQLGKIQKKNNESTEEINVKFDSIIYASL